jgi:xylose isomerase
MIIGMARGGYAHDPKLNRSAVPQCDVLAKHGVALDGDTVRKWLREAAEFLPHE